MESAVPSSTLFLDSKKHLWLFLKYKESHHEVKIASAKPYPSKKKSLPLQIIFNFDWRRISIIINCFYVSHFSVLSIKQRKIPMSTPETHK